MTYVTLFYRDGILTGIQSKGHSGYSSRGSDIFCAAISALMQSLILGLQDIAEVEGLSVEMDERVPVILVMWPSAEQERISLLTMTIVASLWHIAYENPKYITIMTEDL